MPNGTQKLSNEQEKQLVEDYRQGTPIDTLLDKYGFKTKKSITDKVKKWYPNEYKKILEEAKNNRKGYSYKFNAINSEFDAYFLGLMLTDGYIGKRGEKFSKAGIDLTDEDCIHFLSKIIGCKYYEYPSYDGKKYKTRYRIVLYDEELASNLIKYSVTPNKSLTLQGPSLSKIEERFIPYVIRGIIDGDGCVSPASYGGSQFYIVSGSKDFIYWCKETLEYKMFMKDINISQNSRGLWKAQTARQDNIEKLIALSYDKPFGMMRKYEQLRQTFRDYNNTALIER